MGKTQSKEKFQLKGKQDEWDNYLRKNIKWNEKRLEDCISLLKKDGVVDISTLLLSRDYIKKHKKIDGNLRKKIYKHIKSLEALQQRSETGFLLNLEDTDIFENFRFSPQIFFQDYVPEDVRIRYIKQATKKHTILEHQLVEDESKAITLYTTGDADDYKTCYRNLNKALRSRTNLPPYQNMIFLLDRALQKIPSEELVAYRGTNIADEEMEKFHHENNLCFSSIVSASLNKEVAEAFACAPGNNNPTLFEMHFITAKRINQWSVHDEKEVVTSFCSRWVVKDVDKNSCPRRIVLQQIKSSPLFGKNDKKYRTTGLLSLANIRSTEIPYNLLEDGSIIGEYINKLDDSAKAIIFENLPFLHFRKSEEEIDLFSEEEYENLINFFKEIHDLKDLFHSILNDDLIIADAIKVCEKNKIYTAKKLLLAIEKTKSVEEVIELGFSDYVAEKLRKSSTEENDESENWNIIKSFPSFKEIMLRLNFSSNLKFDFLTGLALPGFCGLAAGIERLSHFSLSPWVSVLQVHDIFISAVFTITQCCALCVQYHKGDITKKQLVKSIITIILRNGTTMGCMALGAFIGTFCGPFGTFFGGLFGSLIGSIASGACFRTLLEKLMPDDIEEEMNEKRKSYVDAHAILQCEIGLPLYIINKRYRKLALKYHPDRNPSDEAKLIFLQIKLARDTIVSYLEYATESLKIMGLRDDASLEDLKEQWKILKAKKPMDFNESERRYKFLVRFLKKEHFKERSFLRHFFDVKPVIQKETAAFIKAN